MEVCEADKWIYWGLIVLDAPNAGTYKVTVAGAEHTVVASGGDAAQPECEEACPVPELPAYDWVYMAATGAIVLGECFSADSEGYIGSEVTFKGECQMFTLLNEDWEFAANTKHCTESRVLFGWEAPYWAEGTICDPDPLGFTNRTLMLGVAQAGFMPGVDAHAFVLEATMPGDP